MGAMAAKKTPSPAMAFLVDSLEKNKKAVYGDLKAAADKKGLQVFPIMFGRAQALLGIVKMSARGQGKAAKAKAKAAGKTAAKVGKVSAKRGRPANASSKSGQIRELLTTGMSAADIAKKVGCTTALVYNVKSANVKSGSGGKSAGGTMAKRGPGRPRKVDVTSGLDGIADIVAAVQSGERERGKMRTALERIQGIIADAIG